MASGTIYGSTNNEYIESKIVWSSVPDVENKRSTVTAALYYRRTNEYTTYGPGWFGITIDGEPHFNEVAVNIVIGTDWVQAIEIYAVIPHGSNGSKRVDIVASGYISGTTLQSTNCSGTAVLDDLPMETVTNSLTCSTSYLDGTLTYIYTPQAEYYIRANISLNLNGDYIRIRSVFHGKKTSGQQYTQAVVFTAAELSTIYDKLPKATKGTIRVTIRTYSDSEYTDEVTGPTYKEITLTIPSSVKPAASLQVSVTNSNAWIKSKGICVAGYSGVSAVLSATPGEGADNASFSISGGDYASDSSTLSVKKITNHGKLTLTGKATDSRGRSDSESKDITVEPYAIPAVTALTVARGTYANSKWTADDNGADVRVVFKTTLALAGYSNNYTAAFTLDGAAITPNTGATTGLASGTAYTVYFLNVESESSHSLKISAKDAVGQSGTATITIATVNVTIEFNESGKGIAFGKTSEKEAFECAWDAEFSGNASLVRDSGEVFALPEIQSGTVSITPSAANTPTSLDITFEKKFSGKPIVVVAPYTSVPGTTVLGVGVNGVTATGCTLWVSRSNTSETNLNWIAIY